MNRYEYNQIQLDEDSVRSLSVTIYPIIYPQNTDIYIVTSEGDRLDLIAFKFYKDVSLWWIIAEANSIDRGSLIVRGGVQLRIPTNISEILSEYRKLNS